MYIRPDGKCTIAVVVSVEQKKIFKEMKKNGFNPQVFFRKKADEVIETYLKIQTKEKLKEIKNV